MNMNQGQFSGDMDRNEVEMDLNKFMDMMICNAIITIASLTAALTPTPRDDNFFKKVYNIVDLLALNFWHAKEK